MHDPEWRTIGATWLSADLGRRAVAEMAKASGLSLVTLEERSPRFYSTYGTGELLRDIVNAGAREITLGIGGSATNDGGAGILQALGAVLSKEGEPIAEGPAPVLLHDLDPVDLSGLDPRLGGVDLRIACDVTNPLLGPHGATAVYGPQKGVQPDDVGFLDLCLGGWADALEAAAGRRERDTPGAGGAGGVGFGLLCLTDRFRSLSLEPGVDLVMAATGFDAKLAEADLVITGEGRIDAQTAFGKTALGVARRALAAGVRCLAVGGGVTPEGIAALGPLGVEVVAVNDPRVPIAEAMALGAEPLVACGERLARRLA